MNLSLKWLWILCLTFALGAAVLPISAAQNDKRVALVIGNAAYQHIEKLKNPARDAQAVAERLRRLGFTLLHPVRSEDAQTDLSLDELLRADEALEQAAQGADIALLYYAGHGIHGIKGDNQSYVLPVDVPTIDVGLLQSKAGRESWERRLMKLDDLVGGLERRPGVTLAIFDACREIPELEQLSRSISAGGTSPFRGLARLDIPAGRRILAYSSAVGKTALDGEGEHSPYTAALLAEIDRDPSQDVRDLFDRVAANVGNKIGQSLEVNHQGVTPDTYFLAPRQSVATAPASLPPEQINGNLSATLKKDPVISEALTNPNTLQATEEKPAASPANALIDHRYFVAACGAVTDTMTGLEWLIGPDVTVTWQQATNWVNAANSCGGGWRMPNIKHLSTLYDKQNTAGIGFLWKGSRWPAHMHPVFSKIGEGSWVWSNEIVDASSAKAFNFNQGTPTQYSRDSTLHTSRVFAVREARRLSN